MSEARDELVRELLERLEGEENKLLSWGVVDGGFSAAEVADVAQGLVEASASELTADDLWQELFDRRLLFSFREAGHEFLRTRMAGAGRLFAKLRQMFPTRPWHLAPTLVADSRFARRPRRYPRREIAPAKVL